ncbi:MAG: hypothetical protein AB1391_03070 [Candidatus Micrarchaeota archaeon]
MKKILYEKKKILKCLFRMPILLILANLLVLTNISFASLSLSEIVLSKSVFKPGESGTITLTITNLNSSYILEAIGVEISGGPEFTYTGWFSLGNLNPLTSTTIVVPVKVNENAKSAIYPFTIKVYGSTPIIESSSESFRSSRSVAVSVLRKPLLSLEYENTLNENDAFGIKIVNNGGAAKNMRVSVLQPFAINGMDSIYIGDVENSTNILLNLSVASVVEGQNVLQFLFTYDDELGNEINETKNIQIIVKRKIIAMSFTQLSDITSKKDNKVLFKVTNGKRQINDAKLRFIDPNIILKNDDEIKIGDLKADEVKEFSFMAYINLSPGTNNVNATITYIEDGKEKTKNTAIAFTITSFSDVQVYIEAKSPPFRKGEEQTLSVTVANTWDYGIGSLSVGVESDFFDLVNGYGEKYIGTLSRDDYSSAQFKIRIKDDAPSNINITVRVKYRDTLGNLIERKKIYAMKIEDAQQLENNEHNDQLLFIFIGVIIVVVACWFFFRKKKAAIYG